MKPALCCAPILLLLYGEIKAQSSQDTSLYNLAYTNAVNSYIKASASQAPYLSGPLYPKYPFYISEGQPYYKYKVAMPGTLWYDDLRYDSVKLLYDEVADEVLAEDFYHTEMIRLPKDRVKGFAFATDRFVLLSGDEGRSLDRGFYQVLYNGNIKVYRKETKTIQEKANPVNISERVVESHVLYYMWIDGRYRAFTKSKSFLSFFREHRKAVREHLAQKGLNVKSLSDESIAEAASYFDQLKH